MIEGLGYKCERRVNGGITTHEGFSISGRVEALVQQNKEVLRGRAYTNYVSGGIKFLAQ